MKSNWTIIAIALFLIGASATSTTVATITDDADNTTAAEIPITSHDEETAANSSTTAEIPITSHDEETVANSSTTAEIPTTSHDEETVANSSTTAEQPTTDNDEETVADDSTTAEEKTTRNSEGPTTADEEPVTAGRSGAENRPPEPEKTFHFISFSIGVLVTVGVVLVIFVASFCWLRYRRRGEYKSVD